MEQFGDLVLIDHIAKKYPQYTHDDIFELDCDFVYTLIYKDSLEQDIHEKANTAKGKLAQARAKSRKK